MVDMPVYLRRPCLNAVLCLPYTVDFHLNKKTICPGSLLTFFLGKNTARWRKRERKRDTSQKEGFRFEVRKNFQMVKAARRGIELPKRMRTFSAWKSRGHIPARNRAGLHSLCPQRPLEVTWAALGMCSSGVPGLAHTNRGARNRADLQYTERF